MSVIRKKISYKQTFEVADSWKIFHFCSYLLLLYFIGVFFYVRFRSHTESTRLANWLTYHQMTYSGYRGNSIINKNLRNQKEANWWPRLWKFELFCHPASRSSSIEWHSWEAGFVSGAVLKQNAETLRGAKSTNPACQIGSPIVYILLQYCLHQYWMGL